MEKTFLKLDFPPSHVTYRAEYVPVPTDPLVRYTATVLLRPVLLGFKGQVSYDTAMTVQTTSLDIACSQILGYVAYCPTPSGLLASGSSCGRGAVTRGPTGLLACNRTTRSRASSELALRPEPGVMLFHMPPIPNACHTLRQKNLLRDRSIPFSPVVYIPVSLGDSSCFCERNRQRRLPATFVWRLEVGKEAGQRAFYQLWAMPETGHVAWVRYCIISSDLLTRRDFNVDRISFLQF